jgi:hypothetical protein
MIPECLTSEEGGGDRRRRNERPSTRAQFDYRLLLIIKTTLGLLVGEPEGLRIGFGGGDRSRMQRKPDIKALADPKRLKSDVEAVTRPPSPSRS